MADDGEININECNSSFKKSVQNRQDEYGRLKINENTSSSANHSITSRHLSIPFDGNAVNGDLTKKQNGTAVRTNSLGSGARTPPIERKSKLSAFGRLFKPWKWKRKKKSEKFEATSRSLERKISVRANRDELVKKGILPPESPISTIPESGEDLSPMYGGTAVTVAMQIQQQQAALAAAAAAHHHHQNNNIDIKKDKLDNGGDLNRLERPSSLLANKIMNRRLCYPGDSAEQNMAFHQTDSGKDGPLVLSELPEPPLGVCEIGPIPPPPMFSSPSPPRRRLSPPPPPQTNSSDEDSDMDDDDDDHLRVEPRMEEVPTKEPRFTAKPLKSALKKRQPANMKNFNASFNLGRMENKENTRPEDIEVMDTVAKRQHLNFKLSTRPNVQELINRNILPLQSEQDRQESREAIGARLIRRLSMRPTAEELVERNILKSQSPAEEKKQKEEKKRYLLRKLSFRPTVEELKEKKIIRFNDYIEVTQAHDYDRRADKPWTRLTPKDKAAIRRELNEFKSSEMAVHEESKHLTRYHRP